MKNPLIIILVLVLVGIVGYFVFSEPAPEPTTHIMDDGTVMTNDDPVMETETAPQTTPEPQATETGSDAGMEFPTVDANIDLNAGGEVKVFNVAGVNHLFDVKEIRVQEGDTVTINFSSDEGFHDWVLDEFDAATEKVRPDTVTSVTFTATKKGVFEYYCSVGDHREKGMVGTFIVE